MWRSWKAKGQEHAPHPHMEWGRQMAMVNHFYFYVWDPDWGPAFWKTNAYAPYPVWLWLKPATSGPNSVLTGPVSATPRWTTGSKHLCDAQAADAQPVPDVATFAQVTQPSTDADGLHAPGLRFGDPRVMAPLAAVVRFTHLVAGFSNRQLVALVATLLDAPYSSRQAT